MKKIEGNKQKDNENIIKLRNLGWQVLSIFECQLKTNNLENNLNNLISELH
jgi:DNA mismatch endonuclease (patch repair protein)